MKLKRELGLKEVVATVVTAVIGGGLFLSTIQIQSKVPVGSAIIISIILAAIPAFFMAICYAVLSSAMPSSGGEYICEQNSGSIYWFYNYMGTVVCNDCGHCCDGGGRYYTYNKFL